MNDVSLNRSNKDHPKTSPDTSFDKLPAHNATLSQVNGNHLVSSFIRSNPSAALASVNQLGHPNISLINCVAGSDLAIYFSLKARGRQHQNLSGQGVVSMVFSSQRMQMLQLSGEAEEINDLELSHNVLHSLIKQRLHNPSAPKPKSGKLRCHNSGGIIIFKVTPQEMTYSEFITNKTGRYKASYLKII